MTDRYADKDENRADLMTDDPTVPTFTRSMWIALVIAVALVVALGLSMALFFGSSPARTAKPNITASATAVPTDLTPASPAETFVVPVPPTAPTTLLPTQTIAVTQSPADTLTLVATAPPTPVSKPSVSASNTTTWARPTVSTSTASSSTSWPRPTISTTTWPRPTATR